MNKDDVYFATIACIKAEQAVIDALVRVRSLLKNEMERDTINILILEHYKVRDEYLDQVKQMESGE